jgi:hypothetical protein
MSRSVAFAALAIVAVAVLAFWGLGALAILLCFVLLAWGLAHGAAVGGEWLQRVSRARFDGRPRS